MAAMLKTVGQTFASATEADDARDGSLGQALVTSSDLVRTMFEAHVLGSAAVEAEVLAGALSEAEPLVEALIEARDHLRDRARELKAAIEPVEAYVYRPPTSLQLDMPDFHPRDARNLRVFNRAHERLRAVVDALISDVDAAGERLEGAADDFRGADLSAEELEGVDLAGVVWDATTRWPVEWAERIARTSGEVRPGVLVVLPRLSGDFTALDGVGV
ncbi:hypothetical protein [Streptomyces durhamensis]|uniref:hypothetical protein n=1 Tax=Streptomyces durhamensis TaxID=68194 RepID=UPI0004CD3D76|nr:hypothetical protein [Streptomyces durhamensis]